MTRRLLLGYLTITTFIVLVLGVPLGIVSARNERSNLVAGVRTDAARLATFAAVPLNAASNSAALRAVANDYGRVTDGRVVIVDATGAAVADSDGPAGASFASRPEVALALQGRQASGFRHSRTLGSDLLYVAEPVNAAGRVVGAVRITYPATVVESRIRRSWTVIGLTGVLVLAAVAGLSLAVARSVISPVRALAAAASSLGEGELNTRVAARDGPPELHELAERFNATAANLQRLVQAQQAFVADASHQLRTPLAALRLRLENLDAKLTTGPQRDDTRASLAEVHRLTRLVDGLLVLARAESAPANPVPTDVDAVASGRCEAWSALALERGVRLRLTGTGVGALAMVSPDSLEQELDNLLANALDASPPGTTVTVALTAAPRTVEIAVLDEGPGMSAAARAAAFDRFLSRAKPGGFGLGLAITQRLARRDGGELDLGEAPSGGLAARLRLQRAQSPALAPGEDQRKPRSGRLTLPHLGPPRAR